MVKNIMKRKPKIDTSKPSKVYMSKSKIKRNLRLTRLGKVFNMKKYRA